MSVTQAEVLAGVKDIVVEVAGIDPTTIEMEKRFNEDLELSLITHLTLPTNREV